MKKLFPFIVAFIVAYYIYEQNAFDDEVTDSTHADVESVDFGARESETASRRESSDRLLERAYLERQTGYQVQGEGNVLRVLSDDNEGSRHQRFVLQLGSGQSLMIAHNIDLAPRIEALREGDRVSFYGEYEWNERGGVIHWTHHDPEGRHVAGWLEKDGRRYQ